MWVSAIFSEKSGFHSISLKKWITNTQIFGSWTREEEKWGFVLMFCLFSHDHSEKSIKYFQNLCTRRML